MSTSSPPSAPPMTLDTLTLWSAARVSTCASASVSPTSVAGVRSACAAIVTPFLRLALPPAVLTVTTARRRRRPARSA